MPARRDRFALCEAPHAGSARVAGTMVRQRGESVMSANDAKVERRRSVLPAAWRKRWHKRRASGSPAPDIVYNPACVAFRVVLIGGAVLAALLLLCWNAGLLKNARSYERSPVPQVFSLGPPPRFQRAPAD
jgi:hypothetical protein